jgi:hypothetical protein
MKKLIGLLAILMLTTTIFGQINYGNFSSIETTPTGNNTIEDGIRCGGGYNSIPVVNLLREKFIYMLAYESTASNGKLGCYENTKRVVNFYCKDTTDVKNPWIKVCDSVFVGEYTNRNNYQDVDFFKYDSLRHNTSNSKIVMKRANLLIYLDIHTMVDNSANTKQKVIYLKRKEPVTSDGMFFYTAIPQK